MIFDLRIDVFSGKTSGWLCFTSGRYAVHFLGIKKPEPLGWSVEAYDQCMTYFSLGWFFLYVRCNYPIEG